ncbi:MAG: MIP/aquaporin family protein [Microscillaceae bacterium]|nr:MIP/aquaporin family protein [Microscillaceae bacterium]
MNPFLGELIGTALLVLLGNGVVANVVLKRTHGENAGLLAITLGWAMAVFVGVFTVAEFSGAHLNPAVTIGLAVAGLFEWVKVPAYLAAQFLGAALGALLVWLHYFPHFAHTEDQGAKLGVFCTSPAIRHAFANFISELIGTFVLVFGVLYMTKVEIGEGKATLGALDALPVGLLVLGIGLGLGGTTGYAINPARDLAPRLMHALLPIPHKRSSDWAYAWIPVLGPCAGGSLAGLMYLVLH